MAKKFLEITVDENGIPLSSVEQDENERLFEKPEGKITDNFKLFKKHNLNIYSDKEFFYKHCGQHPVIFVDFKLLGGGTHKEVLERLKIIIHKAFQDHVYLLNREELWLSKNEHDAKKFDKQLLVRYFEDKKFGKLSKKEMRDGLHFLSQILYRYFNKKPFILVDDFDAFILGTIFEPSFEIERTISFIKKIMFILLNDSYVDGSLIMAGVRLGGVLSPGNVDHFYFLENHKFAEYFGFTEAEVGRLINKTRISEKLEEIKQRYNGYRVLGNDYKIYCPWSVIGYLETGKLESDLIKFDSIPNLDEFIRRNKINSKMQTLLKGETIRLCSLKAPDVKQIRDLKDIIKSPYYFPDIEGNIVLFFHFMCENGYLNVVKKHRNYIDVVIPNAEIGFELHWMLHTRGYYRKTYNLDEGKEINSFVKALLLLDKNNHTFENFLKSFERLYSDNVILPKDDFEFRDIIHYCVKYYTDLNVLDDGRFIGKKRRHDLVIFRPGGTVIVVLVKYNSGSSYEGLQEIVTNNYYKFDEDKEMMIKDKILLGLHLDMNRNVSVSYLVNSEDVAKVCSLRSY